MLLIHWINTWPVASGDALVESLAPARHAQAMFTGTSRKGSGEGELSRKAFNILCEKCDNLDYGKYSVCSQHVCKDKFNFYFHFLSSSSFHEN
jgi:hypothetical protein